jgi:hypothetical protein
MREIIPDADDLYYRTSKQGRRVVGVEGTEAGTREDPRGVRRLGAAPAYDKQRFQVKRHTGGDVTATAEAQLISVVQHGSATDRADQTWACYDRAFPETTFAGIYVCKPYSHGYGDAVDISYGPTPKVFDWGIRMAKSGNLVAEQIIGTQDGKTEREAWRDTGYQIESYGGNGSHLWHVHGCGHARDSSPPCMDCVVRPAHLRRDRGRRRGRRRSPPGGPERALEGTTVRDLEADDLEIELASCRADRLEDRRRIYELRGKLADAGLEP